MDNTTFRAVRYVLKVRKFQLPSRLTVKSVVLQKNYDQKMYF